MSPVSGTSPSWVQLFPGQGQDGPACPAELSQLSKLYLLKTSSSHFSVTHDTWQSFGRKAM